MVNKYRRALEGREYNSRTGKIWAIQDVPNAWRNKTIEAITADGYIILEDGTVDRPAPEPDPEPEEEPAEEETPVEGEE